MKTGQKCFCAVHDKHLFHIIFNEALLIGAANSAVSEKNPEIIDSVRKFVKSRPFPKISENFRKENKETNQTKKCNKKQKRKTKNKDLATSLPTAIFGQIFFCFLCFWFCWSVWLLGPQSFLLCRKLVLNH